MGILIFAWLALGALGAFLRSFALDTALDEFLMFTALGPITLVAGSAYWLETRKRELVLSKGQLKLKEKK